MTDELEVDVAARIKAARLLRGITQDELARRVAEAGLPWRLVGALERGQTELRSAQRAVLAQALGLPERWFTVPIDDLAPVEPERVILDRYAELLSRMDRIESILRSR